MTEGAARRASDEVLAAARAGDDVSFGEIWRWLHLPLVRWLSVVASGDVEDIASEVWLSIARNLASFRGDERDFRGWVFTIARRRAIDWRRHRQRQPRTTDLDGVDADHAELNSAETDTAAAPCSARSRLSSAKCWRFGSSLACPCATPQPSLATARARCGSSVTGPCGA